MLSVDDMIKEREKRKIREASLAAAGSGGLSGALLGGAGALLSGTKSLPGLLGKTALAGLGAGAMSGGSTYLGSSILGAPAEGEPGGYTNRALLGGALGGGAIGAGLGGLLGAGKLGWLAKIPKVAAAIKREGPLNNLVTDQIKKMAKAGTGRTAAALGIGGAALGGGIGANEGTAVDYLQSLDDEERRRGAY